ncbi:TetR/AcrR family transcriptional regulator [Arachidicoccus terrestris]|uniref:TetR/AcrR family transcriptional regulator n=1 Tax=Arachidicoccus terrestris TaxID=2875539 RepID=UPI001CC37339|nr:TetR/AcrR family transcriptional regulator [Arachidicoccus terrestris]UAY55997.1 TetR/AcrR family transcriptional regulator [Arachidicoccus terrestris]
MRNERKNSIRQTIVDTAARLFYKQGYSNTGINQIIEESGVVKSSLYATFRSKEDILMEYLIAAGAATDNALLTAANKFKEPKDKVLGVFDYLMSLVQEKEYYGCNFLNIISEIPKDTERVVKQIRTQKNGVRKLFALLLAPVGKEELADEIYILFEGALIGNKVHGATWPVKSARKTVERLLN